MMLNLRSKLKNILPQDLKNIYHFFVALFSVIYFGYPARKLKVIGVTGTDGKTTTCTMIYEILKKSGYKAALVSTVSAYIGAEKIDTGFHVTAPDPYMLQRLLKRIADKGINYVVLEATSHGLDQYRLFGTNIQVAVLTNITHEHLDYHKTYENYVYAKSKLFKGVKLAIINRSDKSYESINKLIAKNIKTVAYDLESVPVLVRTTIESKFPEKYNRQNALAAYFASKYFNVNDEIAIKAFREFQGVEGRMEEIENNRGFRTIVDFAHTPNALENVLSALKIQVKKGGKLISVFGCASERDNEKRPMMGKISAKLADISVFTSEDPRREDPQKIIDQIISGAKQNKRPNKFYSEPDRNKAIYLAINKLAKKGDIVVMCGKGHEKSMNIGGTEYAWDDKKAIENALKGKKAKH
jgi:UDP-N-acetylmuramoyl-L-alanyl-D-glutamate--2,6-diaminopimelate ligase